MKKMKVDYGFACGRYWLQIDGKMICQTSGDDFWMTDSDVLSLIMVLFPNAFQDSVKYQDNPQDIK